MSDHDVSEYGTLIADAYDDIYGEAFDTAGAVDCLTELADGGPVLELGVGTGRLAIPLARRGLGGARGGRLPRDARLAVGAMQRHRRRTNTR